MIVIRDMIWTDADEAAQIEKDNFSAPWSKEAFLEMIDYKNAYYFVAEEDGIIIGVCGLRDIVCEGEITNVAVIQGQRNRGIAYKMMCRLLETGREIGIEAFTLEVRVSNACAIHLYEKLGFAIEGRRRNFYDNPQEDAAIMWKR